MKIAEPPERPIEHRLAGPGRILELAPAFWKQTREHEDAQQRLAANVFRAVTLADHASNSRIDSSPARVK